MNRDASESESNLASTKKSEDREKRTARLENMEGKCRQFAVTRIGVTVLQEMITKVPSKVASKARAASREGK